MKSIQVCYFTMCERFVRELHAKTSSHGLWHTCISSMQAMPACVSSSVCMILPHNEQKLKLNIRQAWMDFDLRSVNCGHISCNIHSLSLSVTLHPVPQQATSLSPAGCSELSVATATLLKDGGPERNWMDRLRIVCVACLLHAQMRRSKNSHVWFHGMFCLTA